MKKESVKGKDPRLEGAWHTERREGGQCGGSELKHMRRGLAEQVTKGDRKPNHVKP